MTLATNDQYPKAHLFFPEEAYTVVPQTDLVLRYVFENQNYLQHEISALKSFRTFADEKLQKKKPELAEIFAALTDSTQLRYLYAGLDDNKKSLSSFQDHQKVIKERIIKNPDFMQKHREFLEAGVLYTYGRDSFMRPILIMNMKEQIALVKKHNLDFYKEVLHWFYSYIKQNLLLHGQVENWVNIMWVKDVGFMSMMTMKDIIDAQFEVDPTNKTRPYRMYMYHPPSMMKSRLPGDSDKRKVHKFHFATETECEELWTHINPDQVEQKFGGNAEDLTEGFWPPRCADTNFLLDTDEESQKFMTGEKYLEKFENGELNGYSVNQEILEQARFVPVPVPEIEETDLEIFVKSDKEGQDIDGGSPGLEKISGTGSAFEQLNTYDAQKSQFYAGKVDAIFGPTPYTTSGIQQKDLDDDGYDILFSETSDQNAKRRKINDKPTGKLMQTIVERDEPGEIPEKKVQQDRGDFLQKVIDAGKLQGRIHLNYTDRNLREVATRVTTREEKKGVVEIQISDFFLQNTFKPTERVVFSADIQGEYLSVRKPNGTLLHKIEFDDFIGITLEAKQFIIQTTVFQRPGCCGRFKASDFRVLKSIKLWTKLPTNEPRSYDITKLAQIPKFTWQIKDLVMDTFCERNGRVNLCKTPAQYIQTFQNEWQKKALVVINPAAGSGKSMELFEGNRMLLEANGFTLEVIESTHADHIPEIFREMPSKKLHEYFMVIWCGGDGTGHQIMNGFCQRETCDSDFIRLTTFGGGGGCSFQMNQAIQWNLSHTMTDMNTLWVMTRGRFKQASIFSFILDDTTTVHAFHHFTAGIWPDVMEKRLENRSVGPAEYTKIMNKCIGNPRPMGATVWAIPKNDVHLGPWDQPVPDEYKICDNEKILSFIWAFWPCYVPGMLQMNVVKIGEDSGPTYLNRADYSEGNWKGQGTKRLIEYFNGMQDATVEARDGSEMGRAYQMRVEFEQQETIAIDGDLYSTIKIQGCKSDVKGIWALC